MKTLALALLLGSLGGCRTTDPAASAVAEAGLAVGGLKGAAAVETTIRTRMFVKQTTAEGQTYYNFYLGTYVGDFSQNGLQSLLGGYDGNVGSSTLQNAAPNAVNMMLWRITMNAASDAIAGYACSPAATGILDAHFKAASAPLCDFSPTQQPAPDRSALLKALWLVVMRYDAPESEMQAWIADNAKAGGPFDTQTGSPLVKTVLAEILMDPYFLLMH